ncbi:MAG TPA: hypothetical protein VI337_03595 [Nitrospirales bacterium]|nr:hypothetical protein [Nitrospirales bacterium]
MDFTDSETGKEGFADKIGRYFGIALVCGILWWIAYSCLFAPSTREDDPASLTGSREHMQSVRLALAASFPAAYPRLELLKGQNLDIYLSKDEFHSVPYPDRSEVVATVGRTWCKKVEHTFLPAIRFRDITTGSVLASYGCTMERASLSD